MNVLMYPVGSDDDFPDEFCAIRQGSGEHWFYTPVGEDASWVLFRALAENAKLRKYVAWLEKWALGHAGFGLGAEVQFELDMARRELGVEVDA